mmetsp:Transcript_12524/g.22488  ORF Transcript_12524/g.22488 Transcript_12524/m.22488 type:complete len:329 (+) Transcript_12524:447-1433(+)
MFGEVSSRIDLVQRDMTKGVARDLFAVGFHVLDNFCNASSFTEKDIDTPVLVHEFLQARTFRRHVELNFGDPNGMNVTGLLVAGEERTGELLLRELFTVIICRLGGEVSTVSSHDFVQNEHPRIGSALADNIFKIEGTLSGRSVGTKGLGNRDHVIVNSFGHSDDNDTSVVLIQKELGKDSSLCVGIVSSNRMNDIDSVFHELLGGNFKRLLALFDEPTLLAIFNVGQLNTTVSNGRTTHVVQFVQTIPLIFGNDKRVSGQKSSVTVNVHAKGQSTDLALSLGLDPILRQLGNRRGKTRGKTSRSQHADGNVFAVDRGKSSVECSHGD